MTKACDICITWVCGNQSQLNNKYTVWSMTKPTMGHKTEEKAQQPLLLANSGAQSAHLLRSTALKCHSSKLSDSCRFASYLSTSITVWLLRNFINAKWVQTTFTQHLPKSLSSLPLNPPASPLLRKPKGFLRLLRNVSAVHLSTLGRSDPHRVGTRSRVDARGRQLIRQRAMSFSTHGDVPKRAGDPGC